jgi:hypothetical protein
MLKRKSRLRFEIDNEVDLEFDYLARIQKLQRQIEKYRYRAVWSGNLTFWAPFLISHMIWDEPGWGNWGAVTLIGIAVAVYFFMKSADKQECILRERTIQELTSKASLQLSYLDELARKERLPEPIEVKNL